MVERMDAGDQMTSGDTGQVKLQNNQQNVLMDSPMTDHSYPKRMDSNEYEYSGERARTAPSDINTANSAFRVPESQQATNLRNLSANFSTDSLGDVAPSNGSFTPLTPTNGTFSPINSRRYSNNSTSRPRPKSAVFMENFAISEDGSPVQSPVSNTPRSRNSLHFGSRNSYIPNVPPAIVPPRATSPVRSTSPSRQNKHYRSKSPVRRPSSPTKSYQPFNFQPQEMMMQSNASNSSLKPAHRKGHKYKHSSVSMNLFQEPAPPLAKESQLLAIPNSYPIPNFKESISSIKPHQKLKLVWSLAHLSLSLVVFLVGFKYKLSDLSTLAHLIFYDSIGSVVIVFVDVMSNFEVWNNSSIAYPFGLGRLEVLVGFALSSSLIMVGLDLLSHFIEEFIISFVVAEEANSHDEQHHSHHIHGKDSNTGNWVIYELVLFVTMGVTLITSQYILAYENINEMISTKEKESSPKNGGILDNYQKPTSSTGANLKKIASAWTKNPTHLLTLSYCLFLMAHPILPSSLVSDTLDLNEMASLIVALLLCYTGWKLVKALGGILLCSYPQNDYEYHLLKSNIMDSIWNLDFYKQSYTVEKFFVTKFNYQLFVVGLSINMKGASNDDESRIRFEINRIVNRHIRSIDSNNPKIELTIDINRF